MPETGMEIIAQVGDTHSLRLEDLGKRRFLRFGAPEDTSELMHGTIHTDRISGGVSADVVLENLGLTLLDPDDHDHDRDSLAASYFITGAMAYPIPGDPDDPARSPSSLPSVRPRHRSIGQPL